MGETGPVPEAPSLTTQLFRVGPHAGSHRVAARASVSVAVPLLVLWSLDQVPWSIYAAFGAFTSLYGRNHVHLSRLQMQATLAVMLTAAVTLGVAVGTSEHRGWLAVPVTAVVAGTGSLVSDIQDWHPPGPLFLVFGFAACASLPSTPDEIPVALGICAASATFAVLVGGVGTLWRSRRRPDATPRTRLRRTPWREVATRHLLRCSLGCLLAGSLATATGIGHPYWAMVSAVVPLVAREFHGQLVRGVQRVVGTAAGLVLAGLLLWPDLPTLALIGVVIALQAAAELWVGRNYAIALIAITPLALLMVHLVAPAPPAVLLVDRGLETLIGVAVGLLLGWATRGPRLSPAGR